MSDKALSPATLELTQRLQTHFPRNLRPRVLSAWNGASTGAISTALVETFGKPPKLPEPKTERAYKVLRPVAPTPIVSRPFKADDTFFNKKSGVKMVEHGSNFTSWFTGKVEEDAPEGMLVPFTLTKNAYDNEIIADLGGEEKAEVTLTEVWRLMERQANGGEGMLLTNGYANIFYVKDVNLVLRAVDVGWGDGGWRVLANALDGSGGDGGDRVFSRNS